MTHFFEGSVTGVGYEFIKWFDELSREDVGLVGGKGANLGELTRAGIPVPPGFCVTAAAYRFFVEKTGLQEKIKLIITESDVDDYEQLEKNTAQVRRLITGTLMPVEIRKEIIEAYRSLFKDAPPGPVAVRSSATAEDLPDASFAGQQDTYLNVVGEEEVINYVGRCWASLWTARATYYREKQGFDHFNVYLSAVVQKMVYAAKSGVAFTVNPVNGNRSEILINASWGLGEAVVSGTVTPDEYIVEKESRNILEKAVTIKDKMVVKDPDRELGTVTVDVEHWLGSEFVKKQCLTEEEISKLVQIVTKIEEHYKSPQDIEWAYDEKDGNFYLLQARPITTLNVKTNGKVKDGEAREAGGGLRKVDGKVTPVQEELKVLVKGMAASPGVATGRVVIVNGLEDIRKVGEGDILVTVMTNPDMVPAMGKAGAIITDEGGRTCHAAIVSRELGVPCIVGTKKATEVLAGGATVTVDAVRGVVYEGSVSLGRKKQRKNGSAAERTGVPAATLSAQVLRELAPVTGTKVYMNLGDPSLAEKYKELPFDGIGLMRVEFIFTNKIGAHPIYLIKTGQEQFFIENLAEGIAAVAQAVFPRPVVVRFSDFRTNEFRGLKGGEETEPVEHNPMLGWRGVSRYISPDYEQGFRLECRAMRKVREEYHLTNVWAMLPFVRTIWELEKVKAVMAEEGLKSNLNFKIWIMAEVPSVIFMAEEFSQLVDGFSIGSNDLTQLILGADRDSGILDNMGYFDERNEAVKRAVAQLIKTAHKYNKTVSICGQGPSIYPEFTEFLVRCGIDSVSVNPDTVSQTRRLVASVEQKIILSSLGGKK